MEYIDKTLARSDCGKSFSLTASAQVSLASKGFTSELGGRPDSRAVRRQRNNCGGRGQRQPEEMHNTARASCGRRCKVPFKPCNRRPVHCSSCLSRARR
jgi:CxxC-x17-CxxC domain-containing protein